MTTTAYTLELGHGPRRRRVRVDVRAAVAALAAKPVEAPTPAPFPFTPTTPFGRDRWETYDTAQKLAALRAARAQVASRRGCAESAVSLEAMLAVARLRRSDVPWALVWNLAGDFVPRRK